MGRQLCSLSLARARMLQHTRSVQPQQTQVCLQAFKLGILAAGLLTPADWTLLPSCLAANYECLYLACGAHTHAVAIHTKATSLLPMLAPLTLLPGAAAW
jgi:hypothetical protein